MRPDFLSALTIADAAGVGEVHAEVTVETWPDRVSWSMTPVATARACGLSYPSAAVTTMTSGTSPCPNLSVRMSATRDDWEFGSWKPLGESFCATGIPNAPTANISSSAAMMTRRGAAMASRATL